MNPPPEQNLFEEVALLKGMVPAFVEKDWHVTQVISLLAELDQPNFAVVFAGGTALAKAHHLLQRFSEDIDFRVRVAPSGQSRKTLSAFKRTVVAALRQGGFALADEQIKAGDGNRFIAIELAYPSYFAQPEALRPHIQVELTVSAPALPCLDRAVSSFINELAQRPPEVERIACLDPVESAADKLSALTWRIPDRDRQQTDDDPAVIRHLHDLAILQKLALAHPGVPALVKAAVTKDHKRAKRSIGLAGLPLAEKFERMLDCLQNDGEYEQEYVRFVQGVSYAPTGTTPTFAEALLALRALILTVTA